MGVAEQGDEIGMSDKRGIGPVGGGKGLITGILVVLIFPDATDALQVSGGSQSEGDRAGLDESVGVCDQEVVVLREGRVMLLVPI